MNTPYRAPHQGAGGSVGSSAPNAALLIDFDNVTMGMRSDLSKDLKKLLQSDVIKGKVTVQRAYADWRRYPQYIVPLSEASIDLIFAPAYGSSKKNATDIRMAIDGMELVFTRPEIGTFILLTGDSDFSSLVLKLKEYGKYVIGVGIQESSSDILVQNCDEYYSYTSLTGLRKTTDAERTTADPWLLVEKAVNKMAERDDVMRSDRLKQVMIELDSGFNEGDFGYSKFSRFLSEAASKNLVQLRKLENGQYEVGPTGSGRGESRPRRREEGREEGRGRGRGGRGGRGRGTAESSRTDASPQDGAAPRAIEPTASEDASPSMGGEPETATGPERAPSSGAETGPVAGTPGATDPLQRAYDLLRQALSAAMAQGRGAIRDSDVKRKMLELDQSFDEAELGFGKFSRFLRQAHDHDVVTLHKMEGGNYEVSLGRAPGREEEESQEARTPERESTEEAPSDESRVLILEPAPPTGLGPRRGSTRRRREEPALALFTDGPSVGSVSLGDAPPPSSESAVEEWSGTSDPGSRPGPDQLGLPVDGPAQIRYLTNSYRGVGSKTAEALVEAFGADLFSVLLNSPERLASVVPGNRAEQVLEGWKADYDRRIARVEGGPAAPVATDGDLESAEGQPSDGPRRRTRRGGRRGGRDRAS